MGPKRVPDAEKDGLVNGHVRFRLLPNLVVGYCSRPNVPASYCKAFELKTARAYGVRLHR